MLKLNEVLTSGGVDSRERKKKVLRSTTVLNGGGEVSREEIENKQSANINYSTQTQNRENKVLRSNTVVTGGGVEQ